jgi:glutamate synthase (ferredoxin)
VVGHFRYLLEEVGPELRQYIVTSNDEERPFSRDQRRWVYASSKAELNTFGFGSDNEMEESRTSSSSSTRRSLSAPGDGRDGRRAEYLLPAGKVSGGAHGRRHAFRPGVVSTSPA